ncbi:DNA translocase FtsK [Holospora obtusa F1]|uniref:DNA translocase FtsK n=1 Tax=Holospora obtusa F1 TaxID=1399147 RepID=W6TD61_HOLOB|nr:DNA translocase FtsK 4TM domain-containing protein [Holospora obtusa]ETZ06863.1 DNA translocase FtsK [Holospora obtusa F1]
MAFWKNSSFLSSVSHAVRDGVALLVLAFDFFLLVSFLSYSPHDPSWNICVRGVPDNLMGVWGACVSDLFFQWFGLGAWVWVFFGFCVFVSIALGTFVWFWLRWSFLLSVFVSFFSTLFSEKFGALLKMYPPGLGTWIKEGKISFWVGAVLCVYGIGCSLGLFLGDEFLKKWIIFFSRLKSEKEDAQNMQEHVQGGSTDLKSKKDREPLKISKLSKIKEEIIRAPSIYLNNPETALPPLEFLTRNPGKGLLKTEIAQGSIDRLQNVLEEFGIKGKIVNTRPGPVVTLYDLEPAPGVKSSRIISLSDDIARSMSVLSARVALIPGKNLMGIELSNVHRHMVYLHDLLNSPFYTDFQGQLGLALGQDIAGQPVIVDLAKMPHLLVAGTTGSGKSVGISSMILSLLYRLSPKQCKLLLIDPKIIDLTVYDEIPHLIAPVITDHKKALEALKWAVQEMELRYRKMSQLGVRNISGYNQKVQEAKKENQPLTREVQLGFDSENRPCFQQQVFDTEFLPYIVIIVDEMADLMLVAGKELEVLIQRLAQMARAAGIHLIMATQRPSVDVITGTIKANFPTRLSFQVSSKIDSRTILGEQGAESLLGQGDMLYMASAGRVMRIHGPFVSDEEIEKVVNFLKTRGSPEYINMEIQEEDKITGELLSQQDALYQKAVAIVYQDRKVSTSYIQRQLQIGYNRAARIIEQMEKEGIISAPNHSGKREILNNTR